MDANLLHISYEGNALEDPWVEPPEDMYLRTVAPEVRDMGEWLVQIWFLRMYSEYLYFSNIFCVSLHMLHKWFFFVFNHVLVCIYTKYW